MYETVTHPLQDGQQNEPLVNALINVMPPKTCLQYSHHLNPYRFLWGTSATESLYKNSHMAKEGKRAITAAQVLHMVNFHIIYIRYWSVFLTHYHVGDKIQKNEIGGACSTYGGRERCLEGFGEEP
jgi:hypothetical protein